MSVLLSAAWIIFSLLSLSIIAAPAILVTMSHVSFSWWQLLLLYPVSMCLGFALLFLLLYVVFQVLPRVKPGKYRSYSEVNSLIWAAENGMVLPLLNFLQRMIFIDANIRYIFLKAIGMNLHQSSWLTTRTIFSNPRNIYLGKNCIIGECAHLVPSFQPAPGLLLVGDIRIGNDVLVSAYTKVGLGTSIGDKTIVQTQVFISTNCKIGKRVRIGARSIVDDGCVIGDDVRIGKDCRLAAGTVVAPGTYLEDGTIAKKKFLQPRPARKILNGEPQKTADSIV